MRGAFLRLVFCLIVVPSSSPLRNAMTVRFHLDSTLFDSTQTISTCCISSQINRLRYYVKPFQHLYDLIVCEVTLAHRTVFPLNGSISRQLGSTLYDFHPLDSFPLILIQSLASSTIKNWFPFSLLTSSLLALLKV